MNTWYKTLLILFVLTAAAGVAIGAYSGYFSGSDPDTDSIPALSRSFEREVSARAVEAVGQPIEGFDAELLLQAFPGLEEADLAGVETEAGVYSYTDGELSFEHSEGEPRSTAERTVSLPGYRTLLQNLSRRLEIEVRGSEDISRIMEALESPSSSSDSSSNGGSAGEIDSFADCVAAGYPVMESYPEQCRTPEGKHFTRDISDNTPASGSPITVQGELVCLPRRDSEGPRTLECAIGLRSQTGEYYELRWKGVGRSPLFTTSFGAPVEVQGRFIPREGGVYQSVGVLEMEELTVLNES